MSPCYSSVTLKLKKKCIIFRKNYINLQQFQVKPENKTQRNFLPNIYD